LKPMEQVIATSERVSRLCTTFLTPYHTVKAQQVDGDEVQAGPTKLSLRDPVPANYASNFTPY